MSHVSLICESYKCDDTSHQSDTGYACTCPICVIPIHIIVIHVSYHITCAIITNLNKQWHVISANNNYYKYTKSTYMYTSLLERFQDLT